MSTATRQKLFTLWFGFGYPLLAAGALGISFWTSLYLGALTVLFVLSHIFVSFRTTCRRCPFYGTARCGLPGMVVPWFFAKRPAKELSTGPRLPNPVLQRNGRVQCLVQTGKSERNGVDHRQGGPRNIQIRGNCHASRAWSLADVFIATARDVPEERRPDANCRGEVRRSCGRQALQVGPSCAVRSGAAPPLHFRAERGSGSGSGRGERRRGREAGAGVGGGKRAAEARDGERGVASGERAAAAGAGGVAAEAGAGVGGGKRAAEAEVRDAEGRVANGERGAASGERQVARRGVVSGERQGASGERRVVIGAQRAASGKGRGELRAASGELRTASRVRRVASGELRATCGELRPATWFSRNSNCSPKML